MRDKKNYTHNCLSNHLTIDFFIKQINNSLFSTNKAIIILFKLMIKITFKSIYISEKYHNFQEIYCKKIQKIKKI